MGLAAWVAPDPGTGLAPLRVGEAYRQVAGGSAGAAGRRELRWDYAALAKDLAPGDRPVTVALLAVGCAAPAAPADPRTAAVTTYQLKGGKLSGPRQRIRGDEVGARADLRGLDLTRLTAVACQPPF